MLQVTLGVPQVSVLGPALLLLFINDTCDALEHSIVRLFADDALVYSEVRNQGDSENFQCDLTRPESWANNWKTDF